MSHIVTSYRNGEEPRESERDTHVNLRRINVPETQLLSIVFVTSSAVVVAVP